MSLFEQASLIVTPNAFKAGKLYSIKPTSGAGDLDVVRATTATRVNAEGLIESVANNVPRLDYTNGSCPSCLVEPQRTNLLTYSEDFSDLSWVKINCSYASNTVTASSGTDAKGLNKPELTQGEQSAYFDVQYVNHRWLQILTGSGGSDLGYVNYDIENKVVGDQSGGYIGSIEDFGTFVRIKIKFTTSLKTGLVLFFVDSATSGRGTATSSTGSFKLYRSQNEEGSYATSYIKTEASAVTRNADVISKTGISDLIGQTEGTVFLDFVAIGGNVNHEILGVTVAGGGDEFIALYSLTDGGLYFISNFIANTLIDANSYGKRFKVAYSFISGNHVLFVNGTQIASSASSGVYTILNAVYLGTNASGAGAELLKTNSFQLYKTKLSNAELAELTTL
jgi:hypothetical protein